MIGTTDEFAVNFTLRAGHLHPHQESLGLELRTNLSLAARSFKIRIMCVCMCLCLMNILQYKLNLYMCVCARYIVSIRGTVLLMTERYF